MLRSTSPFDTEYHYDHYASSSKAYTRPTSPLNFLYPVMPSSSHHPSSSTHTPRESTTSTHIHTLSSSHHTHHGDKRQSRAADMSRLLDPAYQGSSSRKNLQDTSSVYVDTHGNLHDPDFRHFPTVDKFSNRHRSPTRSLHNRSPRRPHWELAPEYEHAVTDDEEDDLLAHDVFLSHPRYTSSGAAASTRRLSPALSPVTRARDSSFSSYAYGTGSHSSYYSPTTTTSTLPTSYESNNTAISSIGGEWDEAEKEGGCKAMGLMAAAKKRRRLSKGEKEERLRKEEEKERDIEFRRSIEATREDLGIERQDEDNEKDMILGGGDYVPTCSQSLRRQWQALSLRFRFGVFRAQKRVMRRVNSML